MTCAHVVGDDRKTPLVIHPFFEWEQAGDIITWNEETDKERKVECITPISYPDLALLRTNLTGHPCVLLSQEQSAVPRDPLYSWGYTDKYPGGTSLKAEAEGWTRGKDANTVEQTREGAAENWFLKIKEGQIRNGLSGAPLLNEKTGVVCGIVESTRDAPTDLGGHAVPADVILTQFPFLVEEQRRFHRANPTWANYARTWTGISKGPAVNQPFQLPAAVADFTGRGDEIQRMVELLRLAGDRVAVLAVRGMGGVGKTTLALKVGHEVKDHFSDGQLLLDLRGMSNSEMPVVEVMKQIIHYFGSEDTKKLPGTEPELQQHYLKALAGKRVLIILDNAKDEQQVKELLAVPPPVGFIVTSRETLLHLDGVKRINLDMLAVEESLELLRGIVGERGSEDELRTVAGLCGQLPLALRVAGSFLSIEDGRSVKEYIRALEEEGDRLRPLKGPAEKDVEAVLRLSAQQLVRENRKLAEWWQMLSVFPASFDRRAAAAVCGMRTANAPGTDEILRDAVAEDPSPDGPYLGTLDTTPALDALRELTRRSLVQYVATAGRYELHDLMRPVARTAFISSDGQTAGIEPSDCIRSAEFRLALYFGALLSRVGTAQMDGAGSPPDPDRLLKQEAANIRAGWTWAKGHRSSPDYESVARILCHNYAFPKFQFVHSVLSTDEQIDWFTVSAEVCDLLKDSGCESVARRNLGLALAEAGRSEHAIFSLKKALEIAYKYDNWDLVYEAVVALMKTNIARGAFEEALSCYQKYLGWEVRKQRFRCHPDIFFLTMGGLSMTPFIKEPQLPPESRFPFIKLAFDTYKGNLDAAQLSMNRKAEGVAYHNLGLTQWFASEYSSAIIFLSTACSIAQQLKDVDWERILCSSLSMCMSICGLKREAISKAEQALMLSKSIDSGKHERSHQIWLETLKNDEAWL